MGLLDLLKENDRAKAAGDSKFWKRLLYYFELRVPPEVSPGPPQPYLYPLILPPESLRMEEPFTVDGVPTAGGGFFVEEHGIVQRRLSITGNTGWAPRRRPRPSSAPQQIVSPPTRSFTRTTTFTPIEVLSGQRHFQFLQDTVFRTYADLKKDPSTAEGTELYFHNVKDDEHWRVIPTSFTLERNSGSPLIYNYAIEMIAVKAVNASDVKFSEDISTIKALKNVFAMLRFATGSIRAALVDLGLVLNELQQFSSGLVGFVDDAVALADGTEKFLDGVSGVIAVPVNFAENSVRAGLDALLQINTGIEDTTAVGPPANLLNTIRKIVDNVYVILNYPHSFLNNIQAAVDRYNARTATAQSRRTDALARAAAQRPPNTIRDFANLGTALMPGDALRANVDLGLAKATPAYTGAFEYALEQGDTLVNLAARFLGDARNWKYLALFNDLQPPFVSAEGLPGTVTTGGVILIPSFAAPATPVSSPATLGVRPGESTEVALLGRDLLMREDASGKYDLVIDEPEGGTDFRLVEGKKNLEQGLRARLRTDRGSDVLYKTLGTNRILGIGVDEIYLEMAKFYLVETIQADPRVNAVRRADLNVDAHAPDAVNVDLDAEIRGFAQPQRLQLAF